MRRFQILRDEWEKHVWDPPPTPRPKRRNPAWVAEETQKYVWQDPRREAVASRVSTHDTQRDAYTFDISSMDRSAIKSRFDEKIGYKGQSMGHSPYENRRSPGAPQSKSGVAALRQGNFGLGHRHLRRSEFEEFDEVFKRVRDTNQSSDTDAKASSTTENGDHSEAEIFNWDDTDSDVSEHAEHAKMSSLDGDTDSDDGEFQKEDLEKKRKGWFGPEDDLFKDD
ncbi:hypothetical protein KP509_1Z079600 [Ceratopteris richardii]|nr:hypothetical protein KP509_1Z079600 [Ceratopteris richardii]